MNRIILFFFILLLELVACNNNDTESDERPITPITKSDFISAVDISRFPEIEISNPIFLNLENRQENFLTILKNNGINTIRLRLWVNPDNDHSSLNEVKQFSHELKSLGFKIWLTLHYSDTWADPGHQVIPRQWQGIGYSALIDSVKNYTQNIVKAINPEFIQIGNEINSGFLYPIGKITLNPTQFLGLLNEAIQVVRDNSSSTKIIIHFAGLANSEWFFDQVKNVDYDIIGLSYYPIWHGKDLNLLENTLQTLSQTHKKNIIIAETAYPFSLEWKDLTNNIVGLSEQLILPQFPATPTGQRAFIDTIKDIIIKKTDRGIGFCYWGAELIAWKGTQATDASPWENQALFNFENKALPVLKAFKIE